MTEQVTATTGSTEPVDYRRVMLRFMAGIKHSQMLGMELIDVWPGGLIVKLPYSGNIVGNPESGIIHGGAITTLMDQTCGMAALSSLLPQFDIAPTVDLRIDYMRPAEPGRDILGKAETFRVTSSVIFTRGVAYHDDSDKPIAHCVATFMRMGLTKESWKPKQEQA
jgi:uncharacterized protein (TIGR00369 family)